MKNKLYKKLKGYHKSPRTKFNLLKLKHLNDAEFVLLDFLIAITAWDVKKEEFGFLECTDKAVSIELGWSYSKVCRKRLALLKKGYLILVEAGIYRVKEELLKDFLTKFKDTDLQTPLANPQEQIADLQEELANLQDNQPQNIKTPLVSSKVNLGSFKNTNYDYISDKELEEIGYAIDNPTLVDLNAQSLNKPIGLMTEGEQLRLCQEVFGEGTKWA